MVGYALTFGFLLTFNEIHKIDGLEDLERLERLELGFNLIKRGGLRGLNSVKKLELNNNLLYRTDDINVLRASLPSLENLDLRNNALCDTKTYTSSILAKIPNLVRLDGQTITPTYGKHASSVEVITRSLIRQYGKGGLALVPAGVKNAARNTTVKEGTGDSKNLPSPESPSAPSSPSAKVPRSPETSTDNFVLASDQKASSPTTDVQRPILGDH